MSQMTKTLLEMSELRSVPCEDEIELAPMIEEIYTDLAPVAEEKGVLLKCEGNARMIGSDTLIYRMLFNLTENHAVVSAELSEFTDKTHAEEIWSGEKTAFTKTLSAKIEPHGAKLYKLI